MSGLRLTDKVMFVTGGAGGSTLCRRFASGGPAQAVGIWGVGGLGAHGVRLVRL